MGNRVGVVCAGLWEDMSQRTRLRGSQKVSWLAEVAWDGLP